MSRKSYLKNSTGLPSILGVATLAAAMVAGVADITPLTGSSSAWANHHENKCNPCAAAKCEGCKGCNPCAASKCNPCAAKKCNPCAAGKCGGCKGCNPCKGDKSASYNAAAYLIASAGSFIPVRNHHESKCNPCAATKCEGCNPCAAKCGGCNPCAAKKCNPCAAGKCGGCKGCNPCKGDKSANYGNAAYLIASAGSFIPVRNHHESKCNPCAAAKCGGCKGCNPCAGKCGGCNPCAANKCNPCAAKKCNPCAAGKCGGCGGCNPCNPCNPCAGGGMNVVAQCVVPSVRAASACNPCAGKGKCGGCNPCAAKAKCGGCNPCAAKKCNPCAAGKCNPCAAGKCGGCNPCNPCNPCGGASGVEVSDAEAAAAYDCITGAVKAAFAGVPGAGDYTSWKNYSNNPYVSATHGMRYVNNYGNAEAERYGRYEDVGTMAVGSVLAKDSFMVLPSGNVAIGPLFLMEKMASGFAPDGGDWKYTLVMPNGKVAGVTNGKNSASVQFCADCHSGAETQDYLFFLPDEYRVSGD